MKALILWAKDSATNLGIQALAAGASQIVRRAFKDAEIVLHDHDTEGTPLGKRPIASDVARRNGYIKSLAREFDVVIDTGSGDSFTDIYGPRRLTVMTYVHRAVIRSGTPLVLAPQTLGPFETTIGRVLGKRSLRKAARVYSRDTESTRYALSLGRKVEAQSADLVFALPQPRAGERREDVYINVSGLLWRDNPHVDMRRYRHAVVETSRRLSERGVPVTIFPHVLRSPVSREDDVFAVEEAAKMLGSEVRVAVPHDLHHVRQELATARLVIGARMHACLNALSVATPSIAWSYSRKFAPLLSDIGWSGVVELRDPDVEVAATTLALLESPDVGAHQAEVVRARASATIDAVANDLVGLLETRR